MRPQLALLGALAVFCTPSLARATCVTLCDARLVFDDCTSPAGAVWPSDRAPGVRLIDIRAHTRRTMNIRPRQQAQAQ